jgi:hypothetical protein
MSASNGNTPKQTAPVKVQADRWPLTSNENGPYIATIIVVAPFKGKPNGRMLQAMLESGALAIRQLGI